MPKSWWYKVAAHAFLALFAVYSLLPTFLGIDTNKPDSKKTFWEKLLPDEKIHLGLDLKGGIHLVLGVDVERIFENESARYVDDLKSLLKEHNIGVSYVKRLPYSSLIEVKLSDSGDRNKFRRFLETQFNILTVVKEDRKKGIFTLDLIDKRKDELRKYTIAQAVETIRNRVDEYGVAEPDVRRQGRDRIIVQLPGVTDPERAKKLISKTAQLEFKLVSDKMSDADVKKLVDETIKKHKLGPKVSLRELNRLLQGKIPEGTEILFEVKRDKTSGAEVRIPYLLESKVLLTGEMLNDARVRFDSQQFNRPYVEITLNQRGAKIFDEVTAKNVKRRLAIILDDRVSSAPVIQERIPDGRARITMGGLGNVEQDARDLAAVLRAGALPAPVEILQNRTVGPTLGEDSIEAGKISMLVAAILVVLFMIFYYKVSGAIAVGAVFLNLIYIMACLAFFRATLTLPGIAGMTLTIGMAVDANVIIFERIREELRAGRSVRDAVRTGFERANLTILDANLTTMIAAVVLLQYGTGPIKGFAVTLIIGLIANYYTAVWLSRLVFQYLVEGVRVEKLSI